MSVREGEKGREGREEAVGGGEGGGGIVILNATH